MASSFLACLTACLIVLFMNQIYTTEAKGMEYINDLCIEMGTGYPDLCVESLKSDPRSFNVPWDILPNISIDIANSNATAIRSDIQKALQEGSNSLVLEVCVKSLDEAIDHLINGMKLYKSDIGPFDGDVGSQLNLANKCVSSCEENLKKDGHKQDLLQKVDLLLKLVSIADELLRNIQV